MFLFKFSLKSFLYSLSPISWYSVGHITNFKLLTKEDLERYSGRDIKNIEQAFSAYITDENVRTKFIEYLKSNLDALDIIDSKVKKYKEGK